MMWTIIAVLIELGAVRPTEGHGRLVEPPSRASMWRYGFDTPANYNDNAMYCGGFNVLWAENNGRCGVCGDPYNGPRQHEAGGRYATGSITRTYTEGSTMRTVVDITANHKGWFEFRLCPVNDPRRKASQSCLDRYPLQLADGSGTRLPIYKEMKIVEVRLKLPPGLKCKQCVLQWKYNAGNSWGKDLVTGEGCIGCGPQEQFYGCSDIAIYPKGVSRPHVSTVWGQTPESQSSEDRLSNIPDRNPSKEIQSNTNNKNINRRNQVNNRKPGFDQRRNRFYDRRQRPFSYRNRGFYNGPLTNEDSMSREKFENMDSNGNEVPLEPVTEVKMTMRCVALDTWGPGLNDWCFENCNRGYCPDTHCKCIM